MRRVLLGEVGKVGRWGDGERRDLTGLVTHTVAPRPQMAYVLAGNNAALGSYPAHLHLPTRMWVQFTVLLVKPWEGTERSGIMRRRCSGIPGSPGEWLCTSWWGRLEKTQC